MALLLVIVAAGCGESRMLEADAGEGIDGGGDRDASDPIDDAGEPSDEDAGEPHDAGLPPRDAGLPPHDAGAPEPCTAPGTIETLPCGMCGTVERFCTSGRVWAYGECTGETGECVPGTTDTVACGMCGRQAARCTASCTWETTGACTDEGVCTPGTRTRSSAGCPAAQTRELTCSDACVYEPTSACAADGCPMPGVLETVPCGRCGTTERFCNASGVWEYEPCEGEGVCMPGTTGTQACGMCGEQRTLCTDRCAWVTSGACMDEGTCTPGTTTRTSTGCSPGQTRVLRCDEACAYTTVVEPCTTTRPVDVMLVLDSTGSNEGSLIADLPVIQSRCIAPLLGLTDVQVGVSYAGEFPVGSYGSTGDRPFEGGIEPTTSSGAISTELASRPRWNGADGQDSMVEALSVLSGGPVHPTALALTCSSGRVAGGCWRSGAERVIVVHTDSPIHNGPDPAGPGLLAPYSGISPAPATWPEVRTRMLASGTVLIWIDSESGTPAPAQFDEMLTDLGQPLSDRHVAATSTAVGTACDAIVARVRAIAGL